MPRRKLANNIQDLTAQSQFLFAFKGHELKDAYLQKIVITYYIMPFYNVPIIYFNTIQTVPYVR